MLRRFRALKDVQIYHPHPLVLEAGSVVKADGVIFGVPGSTVILNDLSDAEIFKEYFVELHEKPERITRGVSF